MVREGNLKKEIFVNSIAVLDRLQATVDCSMCQHLFPSPTSLPSQEPWHCLVVLTQVLAATALLFLTSPHCFIVIIVINTDSW